MQRYLNYFSYLLLLLMWACGSGSSSPAQQTAADQKTAAALSQANSLATARYSASSILYTMGVGSVGSIKALQIPGLICTQGIDTTIAVGDLGEITILGDCFVLEDQDCSYQYVGSLSFDALLLDGGGRLQGSFENVTLQITFPGCVPDFNQANVSLNASGLVTVGELTIKFLTAIFTSAIEPLSGQVELTLQSLGAATSYADFNCISTESDSVCFVDADNDYSDDATDNCLNLVNPEQTDSDADRVGDPCDNCPVTPNSDQSNSDGTGPGDACLNICAPGISQCETAADCPLNLGCSNGCCSACDSSIFVSMSCRQAEAINASHGISGSCEAFGHSCDADGCCEFIEFPNPPGDLCADDPMNPGVCADGFGFCAALFTSEICLLAEPNPDAGCPALNTDFPFAVNCQVYGQAVCNELIGIGTANFDTFCNSTCCVEP